ncbi:hypothetical protein FNV43_RR24702 [Rhamnella rubrinervis]|uniref:Uncharacterized protein n=1 Tax=Rhamnella rubrinervis TaxID=2594499 RepID=A0A8K0GTF4_9ROSA|nr:hypothetical protein FNV43_RR24702 [Rhamnella rubrinervis]
MARCNIGIKNVVFDNAPGNAKYIASSIQKEILHIYANKVRKLIRQEIGNNKYCILVDEANKEQMAIILRYVDCYGFVRERFFDMVNISDTRALTLKNEITAVLGRHELLVENLRGQGYDGASNMRGAWNGLQALFLQDCPYAYYVHCFAHRLQLALNGAAKEVKYVWLFFSMLNEIVNYMSASAKRHSELVLRRKYEIHELLMDGELETEIDENGPTQQFRSEAYKYLVAITSFEFVFILLLMKKVMGITDFVCQALQKKNQDIVNALNYVSQSKYQLQTLRDGGWDELFEEIISFVNDMILRYDMSAPYKHGFGLGTARGGVPSARIAVYKVCWSDGCDDADVLAAFDDAIADGVDIISASLGRGPLDYFKSAMAIGSFHATRKGILTSNSAGNRGPQPSTLTNFAPWSLSVAASTIDRTFSTKVRLGNDHIYEGISINSFDLKNQTFPLIYGGDAANTSDRFSSSKARYCITDSLDKNLVKGKIVLCDLLTSGEGPLLARAGGFLMQVPQARDLARSFPLPASLLSLDQGSDIYKYINSSREPIGTIFKSNEVNGKLAPYITDFSSRGPNPISPKILKPDLAAPGVYILAAWPPIAPVSGIEEDDRVFKFNIISGTSMACPHATAAAAYVKSFQPSWTPAAIRSSLITTAKPMRSDLNPEAEFAYGSGLLNPLKAPFPGLIYDIDELDYVKFLCGEGYTTKLLQIVTGINSISCSEVNINGTVSDLNYPSFIISSPPSESFSHVFHRTVTNVGSPTSRYKANLAAPFGINITVEPSVLTFTSLNQKQSFMLKIQGKTDKFIVSASLLWDDGVNFQVRSPIVVHVP